jgi:transcriptional regulator with XRE-family HTH domain
MVMITRLREFRKAKQLTLTDICRAKGWNIGLLSQAERRRIVPSTRLRRELARFYRVRESTIFDSEGLARAVDE